MSTAHVRTVTGSNRMRVRIITTGSHGDVRPYVALGAGLSAAGHDVRVVAHPAFESLVRDRGLDFAPIAGDPRDLVRTDNLQLRRLQDRGHNVLQWWRTFNEVDAPLLRQRLADCWEACQDAQVVVTSMLPYLCGYAIATKLQVPLIRAFYFPVSPTRAFPVEVLPRWASLGPGFNLWTYQAQRQLLWQVARPWVARACRDVLNINALPRREPFGDLDRAQQLLLYGYSEAVAPRPSDWGSWMEVTGYWFLERSADWTPSPELTEFLNDGPPPVCIGFGSMAYDRAELAHVIGRAVSLIEQRVIVLSGWGGLRPSITGRRVLTVESVPHDWLFPRVAAVVHHGGAGTTTEGLRAGLPTVVVPFFYDQPLWGRCVFGLGAGPRPIPRRQLTGERLAKAIRTAISDDEIRRRAAAVGRRLRAEDGVSRAVAAFQRQMCGAAVPQSETAVAAGGAVTPSPAASMR